MDGPVPISETRHGIMLAKLAGLGMSLAQELHARAMQAESDEAAVELAGAFHRISRSVRQSLALEAQLHWKQEKHFHEQAPLKEKERLARVSRRHTQVYRALERMAWDEYEEDDFGQVMDDVRECLDFEALDEAFLAEPLAQQIDRLKKKFDLIGPEAAADAPADAPHPAEVPDEDVDHYDASDQSFANRIVRPSLDDGPPARPDSS